MIPRDSRLWQYLTPDQRSLAQDGEFLLQDSVRHKNEEPTDYSYVVFPFAKLYEGFLKELFLSLGILNDRDYRSDHYRIGKALSPNLVGHLGRHSAYGQIERRFGKDLADRLWLAWKNGRNLVFHYFPHNYRALTLEQAGSIVELLIHTMESAVEETSVQLRQP